MENDIATTAQILQKRMEQLPIAVNATNNEPPPPGCMNQNVPTQIQVPQTLPTYHGYMNTQAYTPNPIYPMNQHQFSPYGG